MTATLDRLGAGVYDNIPEETYHADPVPGGSLSSSGARLLLQPGGPAKYRWQADNPPGPKKTFELGSAAHKEVLGAGPELVRINADEWRTNKIKEQVAEVRERGGIPLKPTEYQMVQDMAAAIRRHPVASKLFDPGRGDAEKTLIWRDPDTGVWRRARPDWLPRSNGGRLIVADYKSSVDASQRAIARAIASYGYHQQAPWYLDGVEALGLAEQPAFVFVFQEKTPPYLIQIVQLEADDEWAGRELNRHALDLYATCAATGEWPGYTTEITRIALPRWATTLPEEIL